MGTTLDLEGLPLLRDHGGDGAETHYFAEQNPRHRGEGAEGDAAPSEVHAPGAVESPGLEDVARSRSTDHAVLWPVQYPRPAVLGPLEVNYRQGEQGKRGCNNRAPR